MSETPSWALGTGLETDMSSESSGRGTTRFWMKPSSGKKIIFLSEGNACFVCFEHQFQMNGRWTNWATCIEPMGKSCPLCKWAAEHEGQYRRYKGAFFTIIDTTEYTDKKGNTHKNQKRLMCCKKDTAELLMRQYTRRLDAGQGLKGAMYEAYRTNKNTSASVGETFEFINMVDLDQFPDVGEFDYSEILKPDEERLQTIYKRLARDSDFDFPKGDKDKPEGTEASVDFD